MLGQIDHWLRWSFYLVVFVPIAVMSVTGGNERAWSDCGVASLRHLFMPSPILAAMAVALVSKLLSGP